MIGISAPAHMRRLRKKGGSIPVSSPSTMSRGSCTNGKIRCSFSTHWRRKTALTQAIRNSMIAASAVQARIGVSQASQGIGSPGCRPSKKSRAARVSVGAIQSGTRWKKVGSHLFSTVAK